MTNTDFAQSFNPFYQRTTAENQTMFFFPKWICNLSWLMPVKNSKMTETQGHPAKLALPSHI